TTSNPKPACPRDDATHSCEAIGSVTGFQLKADGKKAVFRAPTDGRVVAWAIRLSRPNKDQRSFFGDLWKTDRFGMKPSARIAVIKRLERHQYKLVRQGRPSTSRIRTARRSTSPSASPSGSGRARSWR